MPTHKHNTDPIKINRSKWKQLTFTGRLYSLIPGQAPKLNRIERFNQRPLVQKFLETLKKKEGK